MKKKMIWNVFHASQTLKEIPSNPKVNNSKQKQKIANAT